MLNTLLQAFTRAFGRGMGYQAARAIGWLIWPVLMIIVTLIIAVQLGLAPAWLTDLDYRKLMHVMPVTMLNKSLVIR